MRSEVPRDWDAATYDRVSEPQLEWGREVLARLPLDGDETVLDAGCGTGRVTRMLIERLPRGRVIAVDASPSMVDKARTVLRRGDSALVADLIELELDERVDAVFSNAVFHWIADHDGLFGRLHDVLRPGGRLVAQCGGEGNVERFHAVAAAVGREEPFADSLAGWEGPWNFASPEDTEARLTRAGFTEARCRLRRRHVRLPGPRDYLRAVCLAPPLEVLPAELREPYLERVLERLRNGWTSAQLEISARRPPEEVTLDYVRLDISARRSY